MSDANEVSTRDLVRRAESSGTLSRRSSAALQKPEILRQIDIALEESYTLKNAANVLLVTLMPDDSGSIITHRNQEPIIVGHNELLAAMADSEGANRILLQTRYLNGTVLNPFGPLSVCQELTTENYPCIHGTPLLQQTLVTLGTVLAKTQELVDLGARARTATLIMTDAASTEPNAEELKGEVASVVHDLDRIGDHIVAGMGFATGGSDQSFRKVFAEMGIPEGRTFTATSRDEILQEFMRFSKRALELTAGVNSERRVFDL
jgi:hypothetical protein